jgi:hypothetical protein
MTAGSVWSGEDRIGPAIKRHKKEDQMLNTNIGTFGFGECCFKSRKLALSASIEALSASAE